MLHHVQYPHSLVPSLDTMPQREDAANLHIAAVLGDVVCVRKLLARGFQVK